MEARAIFKSAMTMAACASGLARVVGRRYAGPGMIFVLHSTICNDEPQPDEALRCTTSTLEKALTTLKTFGVRFVALDEAVDRLRGMSTERFCVFTFDDGYADNLTHALPVMERFEAPFTVYVTAGMVTGAIDAWWLGLAALIRMREHLELPEIGHRFDCRDGVSKARAFTRIERLVHETEGALEVVKAIIADGGIDCRALAAREGLNPMELWRLSQSPLVTIGAHGNRHINLARTSREEVEREMTGSRRFLETVIGREVRHFAYPFGTVAACGQREAEIAKSVGFQTAVTTRHGTLFKQHLKHLHALPREPLCGHHLASSLYCKIHGFHRALSSRWGEPIARM